MATNALRLERRMSTPYLIQQRVRLLTTLAP